MGAGLRAALGKSVVERRGSKLRRVGELGADGRGWAKRSRGSSSRGVTRWLMMVCWLGGVEGVVEVKEAVRASRLALARAERVAKGLAGVIAMVE
jgi:hypothetical protein